MAFGYYDRVKETSTTTGTGTITLAGAVSGFRAFTSVFSDGDTMYYCIDGGAEWEVGLGTFTTSGTTLARTVVLASSNAGAAVNFSAGSKSVFNTVPSAAVPVLDRFAHLISTSPGTTGIAAGTGAGTGPTISLTGNDVCGTIDLTTGSTPAASNAIVATVTFANAFAVAPKAILVAFAGATNQSANASAVHASDFGTSTWILRGGGNALPATTALKYTYLVIG